MDENGIGIGQDQPGVEIHGPAEFVALFNRLHGAFPDIRITLDDVVRWSAVMTHTGDHLGIPATNRQVRITGITIAQIKDGKIIRG
jgi:predicted ester cyclase